LLSLYPMEIRLGVHDLNSQDSYFVLYAFASLYQSSFQSVVSCQ